MHINYDLTSLDHHFVNKGWGYERWLVNNDKYCGKILHMFAGKQLSWHYHKLKDETFYLSSGKVKLIYGWDQDIEKANEVVLEKGNTFHIPIGLIHRLVAIEESDIIEFSTTHYDEDSIRLIKGD